MFIEKRMFVPVMVYFFILSLAGCKQIEVGCSFNAKMLNSQIFNCDREKSSVLDEELGDNQNNTITKSVNWSERSTVASCSGYTRKVIWRPGVGSTLVVGLSEEELRAQDIPNLSPDSPDPSVTPWPTGDVAAEDTGNTLKSPVDPDLDDVLEYAFYEKDPDNPVRRTRAVIIIHHGKIIVEEYAPGFNRDMRLHGYSMTKSVLAVLTGVLAHQGKVTCNDRIFAPEWDKLFDPRRAITVDHLLRMTSGLEFSEWNQYKNPLSDINEMLFNQKDAAAFGADKSLCRDPGEEWEYSSASTNIMSRFIRKTVFPGDDRAYYLFPRREFFDKLGMRSALIELDPSGTYFMSVGMYATARDWARFGLFCLKDGVWEGQRMLPEGWMGYCTTPTTGSIKDSYGAGFWLNSQGFFSNNAPRDMYTALGYEDQYVTVIPSRDLVIVRMGFTEYNDNEGPLTRAIKWDQGYFSSLIVKALED